MVSTAALSHIYDLMMTNKMSHLVSLIYDRLVDWNVKPYLSKNQAEAVLNLLELPVTDVPSIVSYIDLCVLIQSRFQQKILDDEDWRQKCIEGVSTEKVDEIEIRDTEIEDLNILCALSSLRDPQKAKYALQFIREENLVRLILRQTRSLHAYKRKVAEIEHKMEVLLADYIAERSITPKNLMNKIPWSTGFPTPYKERIDFKLKESHDDSDEVTKNGKEKYEDQNFNDRGFIRWNQNVNAEGICESERRNDEKTTNINKKLDKNIMNGKKNFVDGLLPRHNSGENSKMQMSFGDIIRQLRVTSGDQTNKNICYRQRCHMKTTKTHPLKQHNAVSSCKICWEESGTVNKREEPNNRTDSNRKRCLYQFLGPEVEQGESNKMESAISTSGYLDDKTISRTVSSATQQRPLPSLHLPLDAEADLNNINIHKGRKLRTKKIIEYTIPLNRTKYNPMRTEASVISSSCG
ncbi:hypothetical protein AB6A40_006329 [Gnathostoma spinigerum]|uniref:Uncharacterized protein n=1 Tax=Gnathostoma spinigerum TaxID=75299 RepID=A0ABD6ETQ6_9BILA